MNEVQPRTVFIWLIAAALLSVGVYTYYTYGLRVSSAKSHRRRIQDDGHNRTGSQFAMTSWNQPVSGVAGQPDVPSEGHMTGTLSHESGRTMSRDSEPTVRAIGGGECAKVFLEFYVRHCRANLRPQTSNVLDRCKTAERESQLEAVLCSCVSSQLR